MDLTKQIEKLKYEHKRKKFLKHTISNYGTITETESSIICHVNQRKLDNICKVKYKLRCGGMNTKNAELKKIIDYYNLDKEVYYIFDGITFKWPVDLMAHFSNVVFKNCTFTNGLFVTWASNVTLENNKYISWSERVCYGGAFISGRIDELTIINDNFINTYDFKKYTTTKFGINIDTDNLNILNSNICAESNGQINIKSKQLFLKNSNISSPETYIDSESILSTNSVVESEKGIIIDNKDCDSNIELKSPYIVYNDVEICNDKWEEIVLDHEDIKLREKRLLLLKTLAKIRNKCLNINSIKIQKVTDNFNQECISKTLKIEKHKN